jgi:ubiquinone biosynthesis accessory factor UbiJ
MAAAVIKGEKPGVHIEGDVQLAAEVNWLIDHVRWDVEEDLSNCFGDAAANQMVSIWAGKPFRPCSNLFANLHLAPTYTGLLYEPNVSGHFHCLDCLAVWPA